MQSQDRTWIFNENSYKHRGVWHVIEGDLLVEHVPEVTRDWQAGVYKYHDSSCDGRMEWAKDAKGIWGSGDYVFKGCTCSIGEDVRSLKIGDYTDRTVEPAHKEIKAQPILCHQTEVQANELLRDWKTVKKNPQPGDIVTKVYRLVPLHVYVGELPPGPTCSRCLTKASRDGTV
jgi:hypothetical protein